MNDSPRGLIRDTKLPLQEFGGDSTLFLAHQIGGQEPFRQIRPRPMEDCTGGHRLLVTTAATLVYPRPLLQAPGFLPATASADIARGPPKSCQVLDAPILRSELPHKLQKSAHSPPLWRPICYHVRVLFENISGACLARKGRYGNVLSKIKASHRHVIVFFGTRSGFGTSSREGPQLALSSGVSRSQVRPQLGVKLRCAATMESSAGDPEQTLAERALCVDGLLSRVACGDGAVGRAI